MAFSGSLTPDITEDIPFLTSLRSRGSAATEEADNYDVHIGSVGFRMVASDDTPYDRQTAPTKREQFDNFANVGEQSLDSGWWRRSQRSWHMGAGLIYLDAFSGKDADLRFRDNLGVNPWTPGQLSLLPAMSVLTPVAGTCRSAAAGADIYFSDGAALKVAQLDGTVTPIDFNGADADTTIIDLAVSGAFPYILNNTAIYTKIEAGTYVKFSDIGTAPSVIEVAKYRMIFADGRNLYEIPLKNDAAPASTTLPTAFFTHPTSGWTWTAIADTPGPILAAGASGDTSAIFAFPLDTSGATPVIGAGVIVAQLPPGEVVRGLSVHLGQFVGISTSRGFRVGVLSADALTWGPLTVEADCYGVGAHENSFYVATKFSTVKIGDTAIGSADGGIWEQWGLLRIDVSREREGGTFAWAFDRQTGSATGIIRDVPRPSAFGADGVGVITDSGLVTSGFLRTGQVRFDMVEPKTFRYISLDASLGAGQGVSVAAVVGSSTVDAFDLSPANNSREDRSLTIDAAQAMLGVKFTLTGDGTTAPLMRGYQLKALPAGPRTRVIQLPLLCQDFERNRNETRYGYQGRAREIVQALERIEDRGETVIVTEHHPAESYEAFIEKTRFIRNNSPIHGKDQDGGLLLLTVRKLT